MVKKLLSEIWQAKRKEMFSHTKHHWKEEGIRKSFMSIKLITDRTHIFRFGIAGESTFHTKDFSNRVPNWMDIACFFRRLQIFGRSFYTSLYIFSKYRSWMAGSRVNSFMIWDGFGFTFCGGTFDECC
ncbi:MAG: hypothetical protein QXS27_06850 [Candidatus Jordarchaeaceae archaeon]